MGGQHFLLFGDQTVELIPSLQRLLRLSQSSPTAGVFLQNALDVIQRKTSTLSANERSNIGHFESFESILQKYSHTEDTIGVTHTVVICACRLAELIILVENDPSLLGASSKVTALGLCTGLLPAAALAGSRNISDLVSISVDTVAICFRLALELYRRTRHIEEVPGHWAYTILGIPAREMETLLEDFHRSKSTPSHRNVFIGVEEESWLTLFGPPPEFAQLFSYSAKIESAPKLKLAAYGAVHSPHLPVPDVEAIVGTSSILDRTITSRVQVLSTSTGEPYHPSTLRELFVQVSQEIVQKRLKMNIVLKSAAQRLSPTKPVQLTVVGLTNATPIVKRALDEQRLSVSVLNDPTGVSQPPGDTRAGSNSIAIVGMAGRFPGSEDLEGFWQSLLDGLDAHEEIPSDRFDIGTYFDSTGRAKNSLTTRYGCFLRNPGHFDHRLFNVSPREAEQMSPMQRLLLMSSYEALQMAGYSSNGSMSTQSQRVATYFGQAADDWKDGSRISGIDLYYIPGLQRGFTPGRLNFHYKWEGASYSVDSACASSASAIGLACSALLSRECDTALAGGVNSVTSPEPYSGLSKGSFLSPTGGCKTFQDAADGYCRGEAVGVVVLKRLEDAIHDNDNVLAVIRGHGRNHSAHASSITHPHAETQVRLYHDVLQKAGVQAQEIGFVEMHGTGTQAGDAVEMTSVLDVFGRDRTRHNPLVVGAVKANLGHTEAAAGAVSVIKSVMALQRRIIPPQPGVPFKVNHNYPDLKNLNVRIADAQIEFHKPTGGNGKRKVMVNNFDAAGGNSCLILEEAPEHAKKSQDPRAHHTVVLSARTSASLKNNKERLLEYLIAHPGTELADLAYSTTARRIHEELRSAYSGNSIESIRQQIRDDVSKQTATQGPSQKRSVAWVFSGQGSQYPGMGSELFHSNATFRASIRSMQSISHTQGFPSFIELISDKDVDLSEKTAVQVQLAVVAVEIALAYLWRSWGVNPDVVIGHSLGEYAALCVSGVLSVTDVLYLVGQRALLTEDKLTANSYAMLATVAPAQAVEEYIRRPEFESCCISCYNSPTATVISGPVSELQALESSLRSAGTVCTLVRVPYGFHSPQMDPILDGFERRARSVQFQAPRTPIASTVTASITRDSGQFTSNYLARQAREPVHFYKALAACKADGVVDQNTIWLEIGPDSVCGSMVKATLGATNVYSSLRSREANWKTISSTVAALYTSRSSISWPDFHQEYTSSLRLLDLPTYAFDTKNFWRVYEETVPVEQVTLHKAEPRKPISSSLHFVKKETVTKDEAAVIFETLLSDENLYEAIRGHLVDELPLCPSGIYCDMALTAAKYVFGKMNPKQNTVSNMAITGLTINHPVVVASKDSKQILQTSVEKNPRTGDKVTITFHLHDGSFTQEIGFCQVHTFSASEWTDEWSNASFFVKSRMEGLVQSVKAGRGDHLRRPVVYKLFAHLVDYDEKYQAIEELFWDEHSNDAVANITLKPYNGRGEFECLPYWTDPLVHLAGFVLNVNLTGSDNSVYLSGGVKRMQVYGQLSAEKKYTSYVRTHPADDHGTTLSDVYVFGQEGIVGFCSLVFQRMPRMVLHHLLHRKEAKAPVKAAPERTMTVPKSEKVHVSSQLPDAPPKHDLADQLITIVAEETGVDLVDMTPTADFASMGVDSLMSITIIDRVQKEIGVQLEASFFQENLTVSDARRALGGDETASESENDAEGDAPSDGGSPSGSWTPISPPESDVEELIVTPTKIVIEAAAKLSAPPPAEVVEVVVEPEPIVKVLPPTPTPPAVEYKSNVVLIHGRKKSNKTPLFLITDGAGSATAYLHLPRFPTGMPLYAVESPFVRCPLEYNFSVEETAEMYIAAIKKIQPEGPYNLGGWSAGGAHAFEVSRRLLESGEKVQRLIIIDMKIPKPMPEGLEVTMDFLDKVGLTTGINRAGPALAGMSERLKQHLASTIKALMVYTARPMDPARRPEKTYLIWAEYGLAEIIGDAAFKDVASMMGLKEDVEGNPMEDDTGLGSWFYSRRDNFGPNGWDKLLGPVECRTVKADHFSMVTPPAANDLGKLLQEAVA
ncbi:polyketide synthase [Aspergillus ustus]|uniref:Non-reducing polyketide synthase stmB n=1 Tax=Aspergillus ustus TaxID=40382 RepID=STMB_ASPUT|nr:polyketide synthase [Aspergillus ustus]